MNSEFESIKRYFESRQVPLSDEWLTSCIQWCKEEELGNNYTLQELQLKVYEQWLLLDLRDAEIASLPPNLSSQKKFVLTGNYCLQMMQIMDISRPKHWQLQRIRGDQAFTKNNWQENEAIGTGKRVLQLTLTDGVQEVEAMEYRPISLININLAPGVKVRIMGPIVVRRGRLMLESNNIKVLGGEVEDIAVSHHAENVLARKLNLPLNAAPRKLDEKMDIDEDPENATQYTQMNAQHPNVGANHQQNLVQPIPHNTRNEQTIPYTNPVVVRPNQQPKNSTHTINTKPEIVDHFDEDEELRIAEEMEMLLEAERDVHQPSAKKPRMETKSPDLFEDDLDLDDHDFDNLEKMEAPRDHSIPKKEAPSVSSFRDITPRTEQPPVQSLDDDEFFANIDIDKHLNEIDKQIDSREKNSNVIKSPVQNRGMNIQKLLANKPNINKGVFKIKAKYKSVVEKLTVANDEYKLTIKISDDSGETDARVHTNVVADLSGYTADALLSLKARVLEKDSMAAQTVMKALNSVKEKLLQHNMMEIQISKDEELPVIVSIF